MVLLLQCRFQLIGYRFLLTTIMGLEPTVSLQEASDKVYLILV